MATSTPPGSGSSRGPRRRAHDIAWAALVLGSDAAVRLTPTRWLLSRLLRRQHAALLRLGFEADFYLKQLRPHRRALAARGPALHYLLLGWREQRSPSRRCDQVFVASRYPGAAGNPYLLVEPSSEPRNDLEVLGRGETLPAAKDGYAIVFHHARGGGSTKCLGLFERRLEDEGLVPIRLRLVARSDRLVILQSPTGLQVHDLVDELPVFLSALAHLPIKRIVVSHIVDFAPERVFRMLGLVSEHFTCRLDIVLHDYLAVCARINLVDAGGQTCFVPAEPERCRTCIAAGGSDCGDVDPARWREEFGALAARADRIFVLSDDMRHRLAPFLPKPLTIWRPEADRRIAPIMPALPRGGVLRIAVVGSLNVAKGSRVVAALGTAIRARGAPVVIEVFGECSERRRLAQAGIVTHGRYHEDALPEMLEIFRPHAAFIPAIWPETWSFVLTQLLSLGVPIFTFAHGAQAERLRRLGLSRYLLPSESTNDAHAILNHLLRFHAEGSERV